MKKLITYAVAVALLSFLPVAATERKKEASESSAAGHSASGTITAWDETTKAFTVKSSAGKEATFTWNDTTKVVGTPKVGEHVKVEYAKSKDGVISVTGIQSGKRPSSKAMTAKK